MHQTMPDDQAGQHPIVGTKLKTYALSMTRRNSHGTKRLGLAVGVLLLLAAAGCNSSPGWGGWSTHPTVAQLQISRGIQPNWVYYPAYETYYSSNYQQYIYRDTRFPDPRFPDTNVWVISEEPMAPATAEMLQATPTVEMQFHDSPMAHHAEIAREFPRNWRQIVTGLASSPGN